MDNCEKEREEVISAFGFVLEPQEPDLTEEEVAEILRGTVHSDDQQEVDARLGQLIEQHRRRDVNVQLALNPNGNNVQQQSPLFSSASSNGFCAVEQGNTRIMHPQQEDNVATTSFQQQQPQFSSISHANLSTVPSGPTLGVQNFFQNLQPRTVQGNSVAMASSQIQLSNEAASPSTPNGLSLIEQYTQLCVTLASNQTDQSSSTSTPTCEGNSSSTASSMDNGYVQPMIVDQQINFHNFRTPTPRESKRREMSSDSKNSCNKKKPKRAESASSRPVESKSSSSSPNMQFVCSICETADNTPGRNWIKLKECLHGFHEDCIEKHGRSGGIRCPDCEIIKSRDQRCKCCKRADDGKMKLNQSKYGAIGVCVACRNRFWRLATEELPIPICGEKQRFIRLPKREWPPPECSLNCELLERIDEGKHYEGRDCCVWKYLKSCGFQFEKIKTRDKRQKRRGIETNREPEEIRQAINPTINMLKDMDMGMNELSLGEKPIDADLRELINPTTTLQTTDVQDVDENVEESKRDVCAICCENLEVNNLAVIKKCGHAFHPACIYSRLEIRQECPICQVEVSSDDVVKTVLPEPEEYIITNDQCRICNEIAEENELNQNQYCVTRVCNACREKFIKLAKKQWPPPECDEKCVPIECIVKGRRYNDCCEWKFLKQFGFAWKTSVYKIEKKLKFQFQLSVYRNLHGDLDELSNSTTTIETAGVQSTNDNLEEDAKRLIDITEIMRMLAPYADKEIVVISIPDIYKSFIRHFLLPCLKWQEHEKQGDWLDPNGPPLTELQWIHVTEGIYVWPEPFIIDNDTVLLLMKTQAYDYKISNGWREFIFAFSTLMSSIFIETMESIYYELDLISMRPPENIARLPEFKGDREFDIRDISKDFLNHMRAFVEKMLDSKSVCRKMCAGKPMKCREWLDQMEIYAEKFSGVSGLLYAGLFYKIMKFHLQNEYLFQLAFEQNYAESLKEAIFFSPTQSELREQMGMAIMMFDRDTEEYPELHAFLNRILDKYQNNAAFWPKPI